MYKKVFVLSSIVLLLDQISKGLIDTYIKFGESVKVIKDFFYITNVHNTGAAWGIFSDKIPLLIVLTIFALAIIYKYLNTFKKNPRNVMAFSILIGGILGNLVDRIFIGHVRDFLDFYISGYNFPVFNLSDICIVVGTGLLIIAIIKGEDKKDAVSSKKRKRKTR